MQNWKFQISAWWQDATAATFGTIAGIVLTVGVTFWQQENDQKDMARKITKITLHNLDVRINQMQNTVDMLAVKDSIYRKLQNHTSNHFNGLNPDSLLYDLNKLATTQYLITDTKSETIFSHSFEVWQYLDDEKVIGRISNSYSMMDFGEKLATEYDLKISDALYKCQLKVIEKGIEDHPTEIAKLVTQHPETITAFQHVPTIVYMLTNLVSVTRQLNERNKHELGLSQAELEEVGNLLEQNSYSVGDSIMISE